MSHLFESDYIDGMRISMVLVWRHSKMEIWWLADDRSVTLYSFSNPSFVFSYDFYGPSELPEEAAFLYIRLSRVVREYIG